MMTNRMTERLDEALALTHEQKENQCRTVK